MKKAIVSGIVIVFLGVAFIAFNIYASRKAEDQINKFFRKQVNVPFSPIHVNYSKVQVPVFGGNISFSNVTLQSYGRSAKIEHLNLKLGYFKLFRFFVSKTKNAMKHTHSVDIHAEQIQFYTKSNATFSIASVYIHQKGSLWDVVRSVLLHFPLQQPQSLKFEAAHLLYKKPGTNIGTIKADSVYLHYIIPGKTKVRTGIQDSLLIRGLTWMLPKSLKNKFGMFLAGFGFSSDSIQVKRAGFSFSTLSQKQIHIRNGIFKTNPLTISFKGTIIKRNPWSSSKLAPIKLKIVHMSDNLRKLLTGFGFLKQGNKQKQNKLTFRLVGPISSPHLEK